MKRIIWKSGRGQVITVPKAVMEHLELEIGDYIDVRFRHPNHSHKRASRESSDGDRENGRTKKSTSKDLQSRRRFGKSVGKRDKRRENNKERTDRQELHYGRREDISDNKQLRDARPSKSTNSGSESTGIPPIDIRRRIRGLKSSDIAKRDRPRIR